MAAPIYSTDLVDISLAEATLNWASIGGGTIGVGADFAMQGTNCVDRANSNGERGILYNNGATITPLTNTHFYTWLFLSTPGISATLANRGLTVAIGTSNTAYTQFHVEGSNTYGAVGRVGKCYPVRYLNTSNTGSPPYRTLVGTPGANPQYFGGICTTIATVKGSNFGVDAVRYGTGIFTTQGDSTTPGTFSGSAAQNDAISNRWGVLTYTSGVAYELQGRFIVGQSPNGTFTASYFSDTGKSVLFVDTPHTLTDFSQFIVEHAQTTCSLSNISFVAGGTTNPGQFIFNNTSSYGELTSCTFDRIGQTKLVRGVKANSSVWNSCGGVTQSLATFDSCTFSKTRVVSDDPSKISKCRFVGTGDSTGTFGLEVTRTGSYAFSGNLFSNFGASGSLSASLYNNSGGPVTMSIVAGSGGDTPTFYNSPGSTTLIENAVAFTINILDSAGVTITSACEVTIVKEADTSILFSAESVITGTTQYLYNYTTDTLVYINILNIELYEPKTVSGITLTSTNQTLTVQLDSERGKYQT